MTVHEGSKLAGVSIRTLQYYDKIGLLHPTGYTDAGYRLYDDADLERLQHILLFRELEFPLKDIRDILNSPDFDRSRALEQQIELLKLKKNAQVRLLRTENKLLYQSEKKQETENAMPEGPERVKLETRATNIRKEIETIDMAIAKFG